MPNPRLTAVITALMLLGNTGALRADYTLQQLQEIERLIASKDCGALWNYIQSNQELLRGNDPLATELRNFVSQVEGGLIQCLGVNQPAAPDDFGTAIGRSY